MKTSQEERLKMTHDELVRAIWLLDEILENYEWIMCSDRLPTMKEVQRNDCRFIVTDGNRVYEDCFDYMADGYIEPKWIYSMSCQPTHWMNMPSRPLK
jgi:hypothetical protein